MSTELPTPPRGTPAMRHVRQVRFARTREADDDTALSHMQECLALAFPPQGMRAVPAALVHASIREPELTELSFATSVPRAEPERRSESREQLAVYRVATLRWDHIEALCLIRNISSGGLMGRLHTELMPGKAITIEIRSGTLIPGRVAWSRDALVGIAFDRQIDVLEVLHAPVAGEPGLTQRMPRVRISCPVALQADGGRHQVTLVDVSQGGAKLATALLKEGDRVTVAIQGLDPHRAEVRWAHDGRAGLRFAVPIPFERLAQWALERQREY